MMTRLSRLVLLAALILALPAGRTGADDAPAKDHWAFRPVSRPAVPAVASPWARNPIDRFILSRLAKEGLKPSPEADRPTLIRRLKFDLLGLPPTPEEIDAFVNDPAAD